MTVYASDGTELDDETAPAPAPEKEAETPMEVVDGEPYDPPNSDVQPPSGASKAGLAVVDHDILDGVPPFVHEAAWEHEWIDFEGDRLAFRIPRPSAVTGFSNSQSKYVANRDRGDHVQLFLQLHLSPESFNRVIFRMMHPDSDYSLYTLARLVEAILTPGVKALEAELEAGPPKDEKSS